MVRARIGQSSTQDAPDSAGFKEILINAHRVPRVRIYNGSFFFFVYEIDPSITHIYTGILPSLLSDVSLWGKR